MSKNKGNAGQFHSLEGVLRRLIQRRGPNSPMGQMLRNKILAQRKDQGFYSLYCQKPVDGVSKESQRSDRTGRIIWEGCQTSADDAP